ncbi:MAG: 4Fe-4S ferredoxin, partial [Bacillota bacterium]
MDRLDQSLSLAGRGGGGAGPAGSRPAGAEAAAAAVCAAARDGLGLAWLPKVQVNLPLRDLLGR